MSINDIVNSYQTHDKLDPEDHVSNDYWFFYNDVTKEYKKRQCADISFLIKLLGSSNNSDSHHWCHVGNYFNTKITPFMFKQDYETLKNGSKLDFRPLMDNGANETKVVGRYVVWPNLSAKFLGWVLYLKFNFDITLSLNIPLPNHVDLGNYNLLNNKDINFDIFSVLKVNNKVWFKNGRYTQAHHAVMDVEVHVNGSIQTVQVMCGDNFVGTKNQVLLNYLIQNENVLSCNFTEEYKYLGTINLQHLRLAKSNEDVSQTMEVEENEVLEKNINVSPASQYQEEFTTHIEECLKQINEHMLEAYTSTTDNFLLEYMTLSEYCTFPYLAINVWQYCLEHMNLHNQAKEEDIYMFMDILCEMVEGGAELYKDNFIYFVTKDNAKKFFSSLEFFSEPQKALGYYFALHFDIFKNTNDWSINSNLVKASNLDSSFKSFGFFKKIKHNEVSYIFNGKIYEYVKNKKEHDIASLFEKAEETQVSMFKFNSILNFYMTEDGMFDVCKKKYREPCPFVVMSALKKNFITKNEQIVPKQVFTSLMDAIKTDIALLKVYHAKKFESDFTNTRANLVDCLIVGDSMSADRAIYEDKLKNMVTSLLNYSDSDLVLLMIKLNLKDHLTNIIQRNIDIDLMGLQVAMAFQLLWPQNEITFYIWAILLPCFQDFEELLEESKNLDDIINEQCFNNKKHIFEKLHIHINLNFLELLHVDNIDSIVKEYILGINIDDNNKYDPNRIIKKIHTVYNKYRKYPNTYNVWTDKLLEYNPSNDDMYTWLTRFYMRMYLRKHCTNVDLNLLINFVQGFCYFRVLTNFNTTNSKVVINFCASLAIPTDYEKMCLVITSEPNCGKSSLFELLDKIILVYKSDRSVYEHKNMDKSSKIKRFESQLYIMNEAEITTKSYLKNIADSTKFESANRKYGPEESFYANYKVMITNNDMLFVKDGYDKACSNRIGQIYIDHSFESDIGQFSGSVYECYAKKKYHEIKDINTKLMAPVKQFLANVLFYNSDPKTGYVYYKNILQGDKCYKHNKKCLYIYNDRLEALLYVLNIKEVKGGEGFTEAVLLDMITKSVNIVKHIMHDHFKKYDSINENSLFADFKKKYGRGKFFDSDNKVYMNLTMAKSEKMFRRDKPKFKSSVDDDMI